MDSHSRRIKQSPIHQGEDEEIAYTLTIPTSWGADPSSPVVMIKDASGDDVTGDYTSGSTTVSGAVITMATILDLVADTQYRLEVKFTLANGDVEEAWAELHGET